MAIKKGRTIEIPVPWTSFDTPLGVFFANDRYISFTAAIPMVHLLYGSNRKLNIGDNTWIGPGDLLQDGDVFYFPWYVKWYKKEEKKT